MDEAMKNLSEDEHKLENNLDGKLNDEDSDEEKVPENHKNEISLSESFIIDAMTK